MIQDNQDGTKEQYYPITHASAVEGLKELIEGGISDADLNTLIEQQKQNTEHIKRLFPFMGGRFSALGDSTTVGNPSEDGDNYSWTSSLAKLCLFKEVKNVGENGSKITRNSTDIGRSFVERCSVISNQHCISVFGGVNDFNYNSPMGNFGSDDETTFYGALKKVLLTLTENNPRAKTFFITPMKTNNVHDTFAKNDLGFTLTNYVEAIKKVADYYSIPVLDLYASSTVSPYIPTLKSEYMKDGTHLNNAGQDRIATQIASFINQL